MAPITVRKLVALDIALHGYWFILIECVVAIVLGTGLGLWIGHAAFASAPAGQAVSPLLLLLGVYFLCGAINYVPLLIYAIDLLQRHSARDEVAAELAEGGKYARKYGIRQLWLVVPLVIPVLAIVQEIRARRRIVATQ